MLHVRGRRLAGVFAHPDDETFGIGGTLARYADAGVEIALFCATDGGAGKSSGIAVSSPEALGAMRREELRAAARHLGIREVTTAGHADKGLATMDAEQLIGEVVAFLRRTQPEVVVTFGPEGAPTGHPDHRAISRAATAAFFLAALPTEFPDAGPPHRAGRLFYHTYPAQSLPGRELKLGLPPTVRIDVRAFHERKRGAFLLHATQRMHQPTFEALAMNAEEWFTLAAGVPVEEDAAELFDGM